MSPKTSAPIRPKNPKSPNEGEENEDPKSIRANKGSKGGKVGKGGKGKADGDVLSEAGDEQDERNATGEEDGEEAGEDVSTSPLVRVAGILRNQLGERSLPGV